MYNIILMDLDNTVLDFDKTEKEGLTRIFKDFGLTVNDEVMEDYQKINSALWKEIEAGKISKSLVLNSRFEKFFALYDMRVDGSQVEKIYREHLNNSSNMIFGVDEVLKTLRSEGKKIYTASNCVYDTQIKRLENSNIIDLFDGHFISEKIGYEKPSPKFFDYCMDALNKPLKKEILMVGDSPSSDITGAYNFGLDSCLYRHRKDIDDPRATYTIDRIDDLLKIIKK